MFILKNKMVGSIDSAIDTYNAKEKLGTILEYQSNYERADVVNEIIKFMNVS